MYTKRFDAKELTNISKLLMFIKSLEDDGVFHKAIEEDLNGEVVPAGTESTRLFILFASTHANVVAIRKRLAAKNASALFIVKGYCARLRPSRKD